jgi:glycosyltransferase involved in cell wall biosynthesis
VRIAFTNSSNRLVAGAEQYIRTSARFLQDAGHETALWHENETPPERQAFAPDVFPQQHCLDRLGQTTWVRSLEQWQPDLIFGHGLYDPKPEIATLGIAPSVFFAHNYHGTCISGQKCHTAPRIEPCSRRFGPSCLALYYPRRCGGLHPVTLLKDYARTAERLQVIGRYDKVITHTRQMEQEYRNHGIACQAIAPFAISGDAATAKQIGCSEDTWNLLFLGRMVELKGGGVFLDALPAVARASAGRIKVCFAGDGPLRETWEHQAATLERSHPNLELAFPGWLAGEKLEQVIAETHLHVLPSLWPEPFGLSGLQLGLRGVPTVAFRVGGIPDWLHDDVNGVLAEQSGSASDNLASAILSALRDPREYERLCSGASRVASSMTLEIQCDAILRVLEQMAMGENTRVLKV